MVYQESFPRKEPRQGGVSAVTIVSTEITERKQAEDALRLRNRYLTILNQIISGSVKTSTIIDLMTTAVKKTSEMLDFDGGGIYLLDRHQRYESLAYHEGIQEDIISKIQFIHSSTGPFSDMYEDNRHAFIEDQSRIPDSFRPLTARSMAFIPLHTGEQRIRSFFNFNRNDHRFAKEEREILESIGIEIGNSLLKMKLQEELMQANIESNLYIDIMTHDINNTNMTSILYAEMLADMLKGEQKVYAKSMMQGIHKSSEIIKTVEVIRQIRETKSPLSSIDLDRVIAAEIALFPEAVIHYTPCQENVYADYLISEIFTNLIGNSLKFGGPGIEIWIFVKVLDDTIEISVEDSGPGITDELKPVIFNRFSRGDTTKYGKGLGLFIIKNLIDRYRGSIRVEDRIPGTPQMGAAIRFTLEKPPVRTG